ISPGTVTTEIEFDKPKNQVDSFIVTLSLNAFNEGNFSVRINATDAIDCNGTKIYNFNPIDIPKNSTISFSLDLEVPKEYNEGKHICKIKFKSLTQNYPFEQIITVIIYVKWPNPKLMVTWNEELGENGSQKVIAGKKYTRTLTITEYMGYKPAKYVSVYIIPLDYDPNLKNPAIINPDKFFIKEIQPLGTVTKEITVEIPDRNLIPGNYTLQTKVKAINNKEEDNIDSYNSFEIPYPIMKISGDLNFDKLTFNPEENTKISNIVIEEVGGYTPIEGITIEKISGEEGWITIPVIDYIPPGKSENLSFKITLPETASLGKREWKFKIKTKFAGEKEFSSSVLVYYPDLENAINEIKNFEKNKITENLILMLNFAKEITEKARIQDLIGTMYIYSSSKSLLKEISFMRNASDEDEKLNHILNIKRSYNKLQSIAPKISDDYLKARALEILNECKNLWNNEISNEIEEIKKNLRIYEENNYKKCAIEYKKIGEIYGKEYPEKSICENKYVNTLNEISKLKKNLSMVEKFIDDNTINIGISKALINPFVYDDVLKSYDKIDKIYESIISLYNISGEIEESKKIEAMKEKRYNERKMIE
ncbi:MAG: hypothetical protein ACK4YO_03155, partial [Candidatus Altarchaeaceae archaeon]